MSEIRKKALTRLLLCAVALIVCIVFSVLLLTGKFDGKTSSSSADSTAASDSVDSAASDAAVSGVDDPTADSFTAEAPAEDTPAEETPTEDAPSEEVPAEPEPTAVPQFDGLSVQPTTIYNEGEQPSYTVTPDNNLNMRSGPSTDYDVLAKVPASTGVTALGANEDGSWVVVNYNGQYGWLKAEFLS